MGVKGIKIRFNNIEMIRRFGREIEADPNMAHTYVNKGLATYVENKNISNLGVEIRENKPIKNSLETLMQNVKKVEYFFRDTIFPINVIPSL